ncbi:hypothetical protein BO86DRAFT_235742 [Aspergillus japonicus CBS 114.51]|uniref:Uncharacterized protein n=1 Tax=Aspergillus japonicus CBS 114.51 TaxID=1448312 RepID=A0A8T8WNP6_ASPJA|nr:hypothetical protein BO86DRAFT_235742 [Aspergillus japonicus CBS 114.51]RAH77009.1 hypothetical protein BO86DRAFT_235742 [Aspergillus japonicus CBS 114.51]
MLTQYSACVRCNDRVVEKCTITGHTGQGHKVKFIKHRVNEKGKKEGQKQHKSSDL